MMKKIIGLAILLAIIAMLPVKAVMQITLYQDLSKFSYGNAGEFRAVPNAALLSLNPTLAGYCTATAEPAAANPNFQTFCVEMAEFFSPGSTCNVTISSMVLYNGGQFPDGGPVTMGTAWLYSQFAAGTLSGYNYTYGSGRAASAAGLQQAIWYLQGEVTNLVNGSVNGTIFYNEALSALGGAITNAANGAYGVVALNLWHPGPNGCNGSPAQDQLMIVPEPSVTSMSLLCLLPFGIRKMRARFGKRNG